MTQSDGDRRDGSAGATASAEETIGIYDGEAALLVAGCENLPSKKAWAPLRDSMPFKQGHLALDVGWRAEPGGRACRLEALGEPASET